MVFVAEFKWGRYTPPPRRASGNSVTNAAGSA